MWENSIGLSSSLVDGSPRESISGSPWEVRGGAILVVVLVFSRRHYKWLPWESSSFFPSRVAARGAATTELSTKEILSQSGRRISTWVSNSSGAQFVSACPSDRTCFILRSTLRQKDFHTQCLPIPTGLTTRSPSLGPCSIKR